MLTSYWYVIAIVAAGLLALWFAMDQPGLAPDEEKLASARVELESALLAGEPDRLSQLERECGLQPGGGKRALSERLEIGEVVLEPMPWFGPRVVSGRARVAILGGAQRCAFDAAFKCSWRATGQVKTTVHGPHVSAHGVTGRQAVITSLQLKRVPAGG